MKPEQLSFLPATSLCSRKNKKESNRQRRKKEGNFERKGIGFAYPKLIAFQRGRDVRSSPGYQTTTQFVFGLRVSGACRKGSVGTIVLTLPA